VLKSAGETESTQQNFQDWLELDGDPGFQLVTKKEISALIYTFSFYLFSSAITILLHFPFTSFFFFFFFVF
jgi:hypothetical protein